MGVLRSQADVGDKQYAVVQSTAQLHMHVLETGTAHNNAGGGGSADAKPRVNLNPAQQQKLKVSKAQQRRDKAYKQLQCRQPNPDAPPPVVQVVHPPASEGGGTAEGSCLRRLLQQAEQQGGDVQPA
eukprot:jgi/Chrzof1/6792/Cz19g09180.t1